MNEEERQAIERIKEIIKCFYCFPNPISIELKDCDCSTLEIALNLIEKLQKENEELKNQETTAMKINELLVQRYSNSISVQTVKDKIAELKAQYKTALEENSTEAFILKCQITILQELIEERDKLWEKSIM